MNTSKDALIPTGVPGLDDILGGGLPANRLVLVEGDPGTGKTTLGMQFLLEGSRLGEVGVYVTLTETREELESAAHSHGWSLEGIAINELPLDSGLLGPDDESTMFHTADVELAETTKAVLRQVEELKPRRLVFDSLTEIRMLAQSPLRYRRQILALKQYFSGLGCTVLLLDDRFSEASDLQVHSIVHGVISLERRSPDFGVMQRRLQMLKLRGQTFRSGYHDVAIVRGGMQTFPRLVAADHPYTGIHEPVRSGIPELDALLGGGLDRGSSTLFTGPAGTGKSTFAIQFAVAAALRGERAAMFAFDEAGHTLLARAEGMGIELKAMMDAGRICVQRVDPGAISAGELIHTIRSEVEKHDTRILIIDSLNGYLSAMPDTRFLLLQLHELLTYLGRAGISTLMVVAQKGLFGPSTHAPLDASYLADSVILLRYFEHGGVVRQAMSVVKKRGGPHERTVREYRFTSEGIVIGEPLVHFHGVLTGEPRYFGPPIAPLPGQVA